MNGPRRSFDAGVNPRWSKMCPDQSPALKMALRDDPYSIG